MRSPPTDLDLGVLRQVLAQNWSLRAESLDYVPEGGGSHHWKLIERSGREFFVTVDDLDDKEWMAESRDAVFDGFARALETATALRDVAELEFVIAPFPANDASPTVRVNERYAISLYPYLRGQAFSFGPYEDEALRARALDMAERLHQATSLVPHVAKARAPERFIGRRDLQAFIDSPRAGFAEGPYAEAAQALFAPHAAALAEVVGRFDEFVARHRLANGEPVITHGEPHAANLMVVDGDVVLIDWDTVALAVPERDLWQILGVGFHGVERYEHAVGRTVDRDALSVYALQWYLDDIGSEARMFKNPRSDNADTTRYIESLPGLLEQLPEWLRRLG